MIKVSIIVPVYNAEKYLDECLKSLINQTLKEIEIICINDGSTDNSLSILKKYSQNDSRIKIINKNNEGQTVARNIGIEQATGEYLGFVDSDDWVDLDYFEKLYSSAKNNNCDIACAGFKRCEIFMKRTKNDFKSRIIYTDINDKVKVDKLPEHNYIWNKIYRTEAWKNCNFQFEKGRYFEDVAILIKILFDLGQMITVPKTYYYYRRNKNSTVATRSDKHSNDAIWAKTELKNFALKNNIYLDNGKNEYIRLFNITILKIHSYYNCTSYSLFGIIPFLTKCTC